MKFKKKKKITVKTTFEQFKVYAKVAKRQPNLIILAQKVFFFFLVEEIFLEERGGGAS